MLFSEETLKQAWQRAGGKCESIVSINGHKTVCQRDLHWEKHGRLEDPRGWIGQHRIIMDTGILDIPANCEIICPECHQKNQIEEREYLRVI